MGWISNALNRRNEVDRLSDSQINDLANQTTISDIAALPFAALGKGLEALSYPSDVLRAAIGSAMGVEGTGPETFMGRAPTGRELWGMGEGEVGSFELSDIPAAITVGLLDPLLAIPIGKLSKAGELAQRAGNLERAALAYKGQGKTAEMLGELRSLRGVQKEMVKRGLKWNTKLGDTMGDQARQGFRSFIGLGLPGTDTIPLVRGAGALDLIGKAGGAIGRAASPLYEKLFQTDARISGRQAADAAEQLGLSAGETAGRYGAFSDVETEAIRQGLRVAEEEAGRTAKFMRGRADDVGALKSALLPEIQAGYRTAGTYYSQKIAEAQAKGFVGKANSLKMEAQDVFRRLDKAAGLDAGSATAKMIDFAVEQAETRKLMGTHVGKLIRERESKLLPIRERIASIMDAFDPDKLAQKAALLEDRLSVATDYKEVASIRNEIKKLARFVPGMPAFIPNEPASLKQEIARVVAQAGRGPTKNATRRIVRLQAKAQSIESDYAGKIAIGIAQGRIAKAGLGAIPAEIKEEAKRIMLATGRMFDEVKASGAPGFELGDTYISYLARKIDPKGLELLQRLKGEVPDAFKSVVAEMNRAGGGSSIARVKEFEGLGVSQINDWFRSELRKAGMPNVTDDIRLFDENPAEIMFRKLTADSKRAASARFQQGILSSFAIPESAYKFGDVPLHEFIQTGKLAGLTIGKNVEFGNDIQKALKSVGMDKMYVPKEIAAAALKTSKVLDDPEELKGMLGIVDAYNQTARFGVTQLFPAFHVRNAVSNSFMMWLGGMKNPQHVIDAAKIQANASLPHNAALLDRARDLGVVGTGVSDEIRKLQYAKTGGLGEKFLNFKRVATKPGAAIEDNAKLAMWLDGRAKGLSDTEAAARVKKYLFDYGDLSRVEKHYLRRWAYFYTYVRKSIPLIAEEFAKNPYLGNLYNKVTGNYEGSPQRELMPEWMRNQGYLYTGKDDQGRSTFANLDLPPSALYDLAPEGRGIARSLQKVAGMTAPFPKVAIEAGAGVNLRSGRPRQGGLGDILAANAPTNRFSSTIGMISDAASGRDNAPEMGDVLRSLLGAPSVKRLPSSVAKERLRRDLIEIALEKQAQRGKARRRLEYSPVDQDEETRGLGAALADVRKMLSQ